MSNPDATEDINKVSAVRARKQTEKVLAYSLEILFDRKKRLLLKLLRKSENMKNLMENKFDVRTVSEELKQYDDLLKLFLEVQGEHHGKLDDDQQKADDFWFDENSEVLEKLNHQAQVLALSPGSLENQSRSKLLMKK